MTLAYAALNAYVKPVVWSDSGFGLLAWDSRHDLPFNQAAHPDSQDISKVAGGFVARYVEAANAATSVEEFLEVTRAAISYVNKVHMWVDAVFPWGVTNGFKRVSA